METEVFGGKFRGQHSTFHIPAGSFSMAASTAAGAGAEGLFDRLRPSPIGGKSADCAGTFQTRLELSNSHTVSNSPSLLLFHYQFIYTHTSTYQLYINCILIIHQLYIHYFSTWSTMKLVDALQMACFNQICHLLEIETATETKQKEGRKIIECCSTLGIHPAPTSASFLPFFSSFHSFPYFFSSSFNPPPSPIPSRRIDKRTFNRCTNVIVDFNAN